MDKPKVLIFYPFFMHYRAGILAQLVNDREFHFDLAAGTVGKDGVRPLTSRDIASMRELKTRRLGPIAWNPGLLTLSLRGDYDLVIFPPVLDNLSVWLSILCRRLAGWRVALWGYGWKERERGARRLVKRVQFSLVDALFVYGPIARRLAEERGKPADRVFVVGNSLPEEMLTPRSAPTRNRRETGASSDGQVIVISYLGRLVGWKRLDLLMYAARSLRREHGLDVQLLIGGEGPAERHLRELAAEFKVPVVWTGALYDQQAIGDFYERTTMTVCPGDCGLLAIQSMAHGRVVITHDRIADHGEEVQSIVPEVTGSYFSWGDPDSLVRCVVAWVEKLSAQADYHAHLCRQQVQTDWSPTRHAAALNEAVRQVVGYSRSGDS